MLDLETEYTILSAHSKMAAATPPCVQLLVLWSPVLTRCPTQSPYPLTGVLISKHT